MKEKIDIGAYAQKITESLAKGILLNTNGRKFNSMIIGWGHLGRIWNLPTFNAYVREHRFSKAQIDKTGEFTISIPEGDPIPEIARVCGTLSGKDIEKDYKAGLTLVPANVISTPGIREYPITLECKVLYSQQLDLLQVPAELKKQFYPSDVDGSNPGANRDAHTMYVGQIVDAYIIR